MPTNAKWSIDPTHSEIGFKVKHLMISNMNGVFKEYNANIYTTENDFTNSDIDFWLKTASIYTGNEMRDTHLRSADFFDCENHAQINFVSNTIEKTSQADHYLLWGDLTIKGLTKRIILDMEFGGLIKDHEGNEKAGFTITGKINRLEWGLIWNALLETGGVILSEEVLINCNVELKKVSPPASPENAIKATIGNYAMVESL